MQRFYSQLTGTTYLDGFHVIPADAVPISEECFRSVIANPAQEKIRSHDAAGLPVLIDPPPASADQLAELERHWRDGELAAVTWLRDRHRDQLEVGAETTLSPEQFNELLQYLQALRDWPQSQAFPDIEHRPVAPPWIAEQTP